MHVYRESYTRTQKHFLKISVSGELVLFVLGNLTCWCCGPWSRRNSLTQISEYHIFEIRFAICHREIITCKITHDLLLFRLYHFRRVLRDGHFSFQTPLWRDEDVVIVPTFSIGTSCAVVFEILIMLLNFPRGVWKGICTPLRWRRQ